MLLRNYQEECLAAAKKTNTIVVLDTGLGKTLIAVKLIEHYLNCSPSEKAAFLVPTQALVDQQAKYCVENIRIAGGLEPTVLKLFGQQQSDWKAKEWVENGSANIFVGTVECFRKLFVDDKYISVESFSVVCFDECHNATGNSPMAAVMQDAIWPLPEEKRPRILGLTASFLNGSISNLVQKRRKLESLLLSTIICPDVSAHAQQVSFRQVRWLPDRADFTVVQKHLDNALVKIGTVKEIKKVVSRCRHVADELGKNALFSYIDRVVVEQVLAKVQNLEEIGKKEERALVSAQKMRSSLPILQAELDKMKSGLKGEPTIQAMPSRSNKLEKLIELLSKILAEEQYSGIVFVEQAALVSALAKELNEALNISCGAVAGTQYQSTADRDKQIQKFREAEILLLVSTQALQEGIDVSGCGFVVRYSKIATTKAHIQGSGAFSSFECLLLTVPFLGRARHKNAKVYYFENDPDQERSKEVSMQEAAKDQTLSLSTTELREASKVVFLAQKHPFPFSSQSEQGQVNVNNCKQIFCQYCAGILGASVVPTKHLYTFEKNAPGVEERKILSIRYPSPDGWITVNRSEWLDFFEGDDINLLFPRDRSKNKSTADKLELCFVYVVVVRLRERGFLDANNNINGNVPLRARSLCRLNSVADNGITISNTIYQTE